jgi:hypothetical protein
MKTSKKARSRVASAFRRFAGGVGAAAAFARSKEFFRTGVGAWVRSLA